MSKLNVVPQMPLPRRPRRVASRRAVGKAADRQGVFGADVDVALAGADGVGGDGHAFEDALRIALQDAAVHESAGVALVAVADDVFLGAAGLGDRAPLEAGGIAAAATAAQAALGDLFDDRLWASSR